jgi:hypothetical protein
MGAPAVGDAALIRLTARRAHVRRAENLRGLLGMAVKPLPKNRSVAAACVSHFERRIALGDRNLRDTIGARFNANPGRGPNAGAATG